ncbi:MAG: hypothetical protein IM638_15710 [Bacteroidetes bacterium]|nr:hypothetical protein [Bacteroidota bacterium]
MKALKHSGLILLLLVIAFAGAAFQTAETCNSAVLKQKAKEALNPFKYDSGKVTRVLYKPKTQVKEIEVPVFIGEKYRMVFNTEALSKSVVISVYNKDKETKNRKVLFTTKNAQPGKKIHVYEPEQAKFKFYVDYEIPATKDSVNTPECLIFMLGYR